MTISYDEFDADRIVLNGYVLKRHTFPLEGVDDRAFPLWLVKGIIPEGLNALYVPPGLDASIVCMSIISCMNGRSRFLGRRTAKGRAFILPERRNRYSIEELEEFIIGAKYKLIVINPLEQMKFERKDRIHFFVRLNMLTVRFKCCMVVVTDRRDDELDSTAESLLIFSSPVNADDDAPWPFKVIARDFPLVRGKATIDPATGLLVAYNER